MPSLRTPLNRLGGGDLVTREGLAAEADVSGIAFPETAVQGFSTLGYNGGAGFATSYQTFEGTLTRIGGSHSLRLGSEFRLMRENGFSFGNVAPHLDFARL